MDSFATKEEHTKTEQLSFSDEPADQELSTPKFKPYKNTFDGNDYINESKNFDNSSKLKAPDDCDDELRLSALMCEESEENSSVCCADMDCEQCGYEMEHQSNRSTEDTGSYFCAEYLDKCKN